MSFKYIYYIENYGKMEKLTLSKILFPPENKIAILYSIYCIYRCYGKMEELTLSKILFPPENKT